MTYTYTIPKIVHHLHDNYRPSILELAITTDRSLYFKIKLPLDMGPPRVVPCDKDFATQTISMYNLKPHTVTMGELS